jgi:xanthine dehydrogenase YagT iron-sulfur-binding subunit
MPDESSSPLLGAHVPDCFLPNGTYLHELRGQPVVLAFAPDEWNPAQAYQSDVLVRLLREFESGVSSALDINTTIWHSLDWRGEVAQQLGITGQQTLLLLDEQGVLRWKTTVMLGQTVSTGQILAALEELRSAAPAIDSEAPAVSGGLSRRMFLSATLAAAALLVLVGTTEAAAPVSTSEPSTPAIPAADSVLITLAVNGREHRLEVEPRVALLDALREKLHLVGTKKGCDHGQCGACTVHIDGQSALSCLTLAVMSEGRQITTIEGLATGDNLHPVQAAFVKHDAFQCGYCTPGQIMAAAALVQDKQKRSAAEIREAMSGNLCRCAAYPNIIAAIQETQTA